MNSLSGAHAASTVNPPQVDLTDLEAMQALAEDTRDARKPHVAT